MKTPGKHCHVADVKGVKTCASDLRLLYWGFTTDWLRKWREIFKPIVKHGKEKNKENTIYQVY